jgi:hypothetical protein
VPVGAGSPWHRYNMGRYNNMGVAITWCLLKAKTKGKGSRKLRVKAAPRVSK